MKARRLAPAEAVERGRRLLAQRRAKEHWADVARRLAEATPARPAWAAPRIVEVAVPPAAAGSEPTIVAAEINVAADPPLSAGESDGVRVDELPALPQRRSGCQARSATKPENPADLSTERPQRLPGRAGGIANQKPRAVSVGAPVQSAPKYSDPIPAPAARTQHPPGACPIADLGERQCRFACTPDDAPSHRFCGALTKAGPGSLHGSWCEAHLPRVWGRGTESERRAHVLPKAVRMVG